MPDELENTEKKCNCTKKLVIASIVINSIATLLITIAVLVLTLLFAYQNAEGFSLPEIKFSKAQADNQQPAAIFKGKSISHEDAMNDDKVAVVLFYADWCPHCQHFAPTFKKLSTDRKLKKKYNFVRINSEDQAAYPLMEEYKVEGFPALYLVNPKTKEKHFVSNNLLFVDDANESLTDIIETFANKDAE